MTVRFNNYARPTEKWGSLQYYQWRLFVDEKPGVLATIAQVEYILHPTFRNPVQMRNAPSDKFALETAGGGEFDVLMRVTFKDGRIEDTKYRLDLTKGWPKTQVGV